MIYDVIKMQKVKMYIFLLISKIHFNFKYILLYNA